MAVIVRYTIKLFIIIMLLIVSISCNVKGGELQEYFVENSSKPEFISFDIATSIFDVSQTDFSEEEKEIYKSIKKLNILMLPSENGTYQEQKSKIKSILKGSDFEELMTLNSKEMNGKLYYIGEEDAIDEVIVFGYNNDKGFALVRLLADNLKPENIGTIVQIIQNSKMDDNSFMSLQKVFDFELN
ncbi:hypothetical protein NBRC110019_07110 [Neptunitalea chrysea]|uniref:DUF4252 domain-containing protein n=1 Tax=Neptunitalea chrysea TaxID=1647581 RepID=A0A9W6B5G1_9FLAO|nr:DUF4252 domain-containing protein [Neptunitalea chrysea]GLB51672.1 hypothetical protein NBRC110019_07110 [Neptunitalea chrysea]